MGRLKKLPDLSKAKEISIDLETYDPDLKEKGPGAKRDGRIIGIAVATERNSCYLPFGHNEGNLYSKEEIINWAKRELTRPGQPKIGTNLLYDLEFFQEAGVAVSPPFYDISIAEALLDENKFHYSLDAIAKERLGESKRKNKIQEFCSSHGWRGDPRAHLYKIPGELVEDYAAGDVELPLRIFSQQKEEMIAQDLVKLFKIESELTELLLFMKKTGVPINEDRAIEIKNNLVEKRNKCFRLLGTEDIWNAKELSKIFDRHGVAYPRTPKTGAPSFTGPWLDSQEDPICGALREVRKIDKLIGTFLDSQILGSAINGRVYPNFHQTKRDDGGAVTGRLSCSHPNLQFIPSKGDEGKEIRSIFIPSRDPGFTWGRADYSQVELRILAHYALGPGSEEIRQEYNEVPETDYHAYMMKKTNRGRKEAKTVNFGVIYGMGLDKLCLSLGLSKQDGRDFLDSYFAKVPFVKSTMKKVSRVAETRGYIRTILNRRRRFPFWEPADFQLSKNVKYCRDKYEMLDVVKDAQKNPERYSLDSTPKMGVKRAGIYKALNSLIQGSAADLMKAAMVKIWRSGVLDIITPLVTVHDELDFCIEENPQCQEAFKESVEIMKTAINFNVPILVDTETGSNWGNLK